jgi:methyl-accepting chemotaxis protein
MSASSTSSWSKGFKNIFKWNIRNQILLSGVISLIVLVCVVSYFYSFTQNELNKNSENLLDLTTKQYSENINQSLDQQSKQFGNWISDDVFGMAIEFQTTGELNNEFKNWLSADNGFHALVLIDNKGTVLESSFSSDFNASLQQGNRLSDYMNIDSKNADNVVFLESELLKKANTENSHTFLYYHPAKNMSGEIVGAFIAYSDVSEIYRLVNQCRNDLAGFNYPNSEIILVNSDNQFILTHANVPDSEKSDNSINWLQSWSNTSTNASIESITNEGKQYLACNYLVDYPSFSGDDKTSLALASIVPRNDITAKLNDILLMIIIISVVGTSLVLGYNFYNAQKISHRVSYFADLSDKFASGDVSHEIAINSKDEIGDLASAFGRLAEYMQEMAQASEKIAQGDLTIRIEAKSEKDVLGRAFAKMITSFSDVIKNITDNANEFVSSATEISATAEEMANGANEQANQINQVSSSVTEMSATISESSSNAGEVTTASESASTTAESGGQVVNETISGMQKIATVVKESAESISKLSKSANQIGEIIGVIEDIADQTNLLALNAAIEAARAGEQGRGFAVVADEVRKLAERTGKATGEISAMIQGIQRETDDAVHSMEIGFQEVDKGKELADQAGKSLNEIVKSSKQVTEMIFQIASAAEEQATTAEQIQKNIDQIASVTNETAKGAEQSADAARSLNQQAENLKGVVERFKIAKAD